MYFPGAMAMLHIMRHSNGRDSALGHGINACTGFRTVMSLTPIGRWPHFESRALSEEVLACRQRAYFRGEVLTVSKHSVTLSDLFSY